MPQRAETFDFVEGEFWAGRNDQIVIGHFPSAREAHALLLRLDAFRFADDQFDVPLLHRLHEIDHDVLPLAPTDQNPGVRRHELIERVFVDDRNVVLRPQGLPDFVGRDHAAEARAENNNLGHVRISRFLRLNETYFIIL